MPGFSARALFFHTRVANAGDPNEFGRPPQHLHMNSVRLGATVRFAGDVELTVDEIVTRGSFSAEMTSGPNVMSAVDVSFTHSETNASISTTFGRYVTVRGYAQLLLRRYGS